MAIGPEFTLCPTDQNSGSKPGPDSTILSHLGQRSAVMQRQRFLVGQDITYRIEM